VRESKINNKEEKEKQIREIDLKFRDSQGVRVRMDLVAFRHQVGAWIDLESREFK